MINCDYVVRDYTSSDVDDRERESLKAKVGEFSLQFRKRMECFLMNPTSPEGVELCIYADLAFFNFTTDTFSKVKFFLLKKVKWFELRFQILLRWMGTQCIYYIRYASTFSKVKFFRHKKFKSVGVKLHIMSE